MSQFIAGIFVGAIIFGVAAYIVSLCRGRFRPNGGLCGESSGTADILGGPIMVPPPPEKSLPSVAVAPPVARRGIVQRSRVFYRKPFSFFEGESPNEEACMAFVIALADDLGSEQLTCDEEMTGKNANIREGDHVTVYSYQDLFNQTRFRVSLDDQHAVG